MNKHEKLSERLERLATEKWKLSDTDKTALVRSVAVLEGELDVELFIADKEWLLMQVKYNQLDRKHKMLKWLAVLMALGYVVVGIVGVVV